MKAIIKAVTAGKFTEEQIRVLHRVSMVLVERGFSVKISHPVKKTKHIKFKTA